MKLVRSRVLRGRRWHRPVRSERPAGDELRNHGPIVTWHDVQLRLGLVQLVKRDELAEHRRAVFVQEEIGDESRALALQLDVAEVPGDVSDEEILATRGLHEDHLTAGCMSRRL